MKTFLLGCLLYLAYMSTGHEHHVEENHTVLFGDDTLGAGVRTMWIPSKADGVALAAIKALNQKVNDQEELIKSLLQRLEKVENR